MVLALPSPPPLALGAAGSSQPRAARRRRVARVVAHQMGSSHEAPPAHLAPTGTLSMNTVRQPTPRRPPTVPPTRAMEAVDRSKATRGLTDGRGPIDARVDRREGPMKNTKLGVAAGVATLGACGALAMLGTPEHALAAVADAGGNLVSAGAEAGSWTDGFLSAFLLIFFSEIGDKTFFIAVLLALQQDKATVFTGTFGALAVMTVISVGIGQVFHVAEESVSLFDGTVPWDDYLAVALLLIFGVQTILGAEEETAEEEEEDAKVAVAGMQFDGNAALILSTFALVFAAEWGDKSFIATIALSAAASPLGVVAGAVTGHGVATAIAVLVGDVLGDNISERVVKYAGGSLFILFAVLTALDIAK